ncbi:MAG: hypothetical protein KGZ37_04070 [Nitrosarchaeum sp.]|nr:hypothetical protein [Nitrosarchaeum sp.]
MTPINNNMHCDDKRMIVVLKESILNYFNELKEKDFDDEFALKNLNESIIEYKEYKLSLKEK